MFAEKFYVSQRRCGLLRRLDLHVQEEQDGQKDAELARRRGPEAGAEMGLFIRGVSDAATQPESCRIGPAPLSRTLFEPN